jgi:hypothetical protein
MHYVKKDVRREKEYKDGNKKAINRGMPENTKIQAKIRIRKEGYGEYNKQTDGRKKGNKMNKSLRRNKKRKVQ